MLSFSRNWRSARGITFAPSEYVKKPPTRALGSKPMRMATPFLLIVGPAVVTTFGGLDSHSRPSKFERLPGVAALSKTVTVKANEQASSGKAPCTRSVNHFHPLLRANVANAFPTPGES